MPRRPKSDDSIVEASIAELAFLFVFGLGLAFFVIADAAEQGTGENPEGLEGSFGELQNEILGGDVRLDCSIEMIWADPPGDLIWRVQPKFAGSADEIRLFGFWDPGDNRFVRLATLTPRGRDCFDYLCPRALLFARRFADQSPSDGVSGIRRMIIEGHTSPDWDSSADARKTSSLRGRDCLDPEECNIHMSFRRSVTVYGHCKNTIFDARSTETLWDVALSQEFAALQRDWAPTGGAPLSAAEWQRYFNELVFVEGVASKRSDAVLPENGRAELSAAKMKALQRRVEIRFER